MDALIIQLRYLLEPLTLPLEAADEVGNRAVPGSTQRLIFEYLGVWYNRCRLYSASGCLPSAGFLGQDVSSCRVSFSFGQDHKIEGFL